MTEIAEQTGSTAGAGQSTAGQAREKVQETAQHVQEKAQEVKSQAGGRLRQELDTRSTEAGTQLRSTAEAMRRTGEQLQQEGKDVPARLTTMVADRAQRLGDYMTGSDADRILRDVENLARRQPWLVAIGGAAVGFLASRFLKASSSGRYERGDGGSWSNGRSGGYEHVAYATGTAAQPAPSGASAAGGGASGTPGH